MGGTLFTGMTCSALTAGVMALGLALGEIEDSRVRVARMIATMALGGNAIADDVNKFNRVVNLGHDLARRFEAQFGSTQCRALTGCDFGTAQGVHAYIEHDGTAECARIAHLVAERVADLIAQAAGTPTQRNPHTRRRLGTRYHRTMNVLPLYTGGAVVRGFGSITRENRLILMMEWIAEAILLVFTGVLVVLVVALINTITYYASGPEPSFCGILSRWSGSVDAQAQSVSDRAQ